MSTARDELAGSTRLDRMFATWRDVGGPWGWVPVLATYATADDLPDDDLPRRLLLAGVTGPLYQVPAGWSSDEPPAGTA